MELNGKSSFLKENELTAYLAKSVLDGGGHARTLEVDGDVAIVLLVLRSARLAVLGLTADGYKCQVLEFFVETPKFLVIHATALSRVYEDKLKPSACDQVVGLVVVVGIEGQLEVFRDAIINEVELALYTRCVFLVGDIYRLAEMLAQIVGEF